VLLVEDNEINQQVAAELLQSVGLDVDVADNGQLALQCVQASHANGRPYDIVLMDMQMPVMDGVSAARALRETHSAKALPIVAMTANAMQVDRDRCLAAGMNGFVTKPIDPEQLWEALLAWVPLREGLGQVAATTVPAATAAADSSAVLEALRGVQGLDVDLGLLRTTNNPTLYASLLKKLVSSQQDAADRVRQALMAGDSPTAERHAHTLKGIAGNLGASPLQQVADALEAALRNQTPNAVIEAALADTTQRLDQLVLALKAVPGLFDSPAPRPAHALTQADREAAWNILAQIRSLLQQADAHAAALWETHLDLLTALVPQAEKIGAAIDAFDFDEALEMLDASTAASPSGAAP
jgi:CheY-like chemotaxis protein